MTSTRRVLAASRVDAIQLWRRRRALALLTALPLAFYAASSGHNPRAIVIGGIALAFSLAGAPIFASLAARAVDQRLVLTGYRPTEILLARLLVLETYGAVVALGFSAVMIAKSDPARAGFTVGGVILVAVVAVPFGLMLGALLPSELEAVLVMIGAVGIQLTLDQTERIAKLLPSWGPRQLLEGSLGDSISSPHAVETACAYAAGLLVVTAVVTIRRLRVAPHARTVAPIDTAA
jgi:hypothetical protein